MLPVTDYSHYAIFKLQVPDYIRIQKNTLKSSTLKLTAEPLFKPQLLKKYTEYTNVSNETVISGTRSNILNI